MRPETTNDPDALRSYLLRSRAYRRIAMGVAILAATLAVIALVLAGVAIFTQQSNLVAGCERSHTRDRAMALVLKEQGHLELSEQAQERADTDCGEAYSILP